MTLKSKISCFILYFYIQYLQNLYETVNIIYIKLYKKYKIKIKIK